MVSKRDVNSAELETMRTSRSPTMVVTVSGEVLAKEQATVHVREMDSRSSFSRPLDQKPHLTRNGKRIDCNISNCVLFVVLFYLRVLPLQRPHLHHHLHHRIPYLMSAGTRKIQYKKEVEVRVESFGCTCSINQHKPKTKIKMKDTKKYKTIYCVTCRTGCRSSEKNWSMNAVLQSLGETLRLRIETLPVLLMNYPWSREQKWNRVRVSMVSTRTFRRTQIAISTRRQ